MDIRLLAGIFLEGILSFLSPCVLPLIPLYMSYLAGENKQVDEEGNVHYNKGQVFVTTVFFVLGIAVTFVLLAASLKALEGFLSTYGEVISIIGGTLLIIFGLHETGIISIDVLNRQLKPKLELNGKMNYLKAFLLGFVFSLGWSPCIGPLLANAIFMAAGNPQGYLYILAYALGLIIPFLACGLFTSTVLNFLKAKKELFRKVMIIAGIVLIGFGVYMIADASRKIALIKQLEPTVAESGESEEEEIEDIAAYLYNYEFKDISGKTMKLSDYQGRYICLNFATTWCTYCVAEIPDYLAFSENEEVEALYVMTPLQEKNGITDIEKFLQEENIVLPVMIDEQGVLFYYCGVSSFPTTYIISPEGEFLVYVNGQLNGDGFTSLLEYAKEIYENQDQ